MTATFDLMLEVKGQLPTWKIFGQNYLAGFLAPPRAYKASYVAALLNR